MCTGWRCRRKNGRAFALKGDGNRKRTGRRETGKSRKRKRDNCGAKRNEWEIKSDGERAKNRETEGQREGKSRKTNRERERNEEKGWLWSGGDARGE